MWSAGRLRSAGVRERESGLRKEREVEVEVRRRARA